MAKGKQDNQVSLYQERELVMIELKMKDGTTHCFNLKNFEKETTFIDLCNYYLHSSVDFSNKVFQGTNTFGQKFRYPLRDIESCRHEAVEHFDGELCTDEKTV